LRVFARGRRFRRKYQRAVAELSTARDTHVKEQSKTIRHYEYQLATERKRYEVMMTAMVDRILQQQGLHGASIAALDLEEKVKKSLPDYKPDENESLTSVQLDYLSDIKENFWADGIAQGASEAEIHRTWLEKREFITNDVINNTLQ